MFISITTLGLKIDDRGYHDQARWILTKALLALEKYPGLYDARKRGALLKMAVFFQNLDDQFEYEHILGKLAGMHDLALIPQQDACSRLAHSYWKTSEKIRCVLANLWHKAFGLDEVPPDLLVPPLQRALQTTNSGVTSAVLSHPNCVQPSLALFNQQALHVAATFGMTQTLTDLIAAGANIEARDVHNRTPLFLAALNGHGPCCWALLRSGASHDSRDGPGHGHTVVEVAAQGGHLDVIQHLVAFQADLNPYLLRCSSSPLQAAMESTNLCMDLITYLVDQGADVTVRRPWDMKTAIDIAEGKGLTVVAQIMREKIPLQANSFWPTGVLIS